MKDERVYLGHIRDAINDIKSYASVGEAAFLADRMRQDADAAVDELLSRPDAGD